MSGVEMPISQARFPSVSALMKTASWCIGELMPNFGARYSSMSMVSPGGKRPRQSRNVLIEPGDKAESILIENSADRLFG